MPGRTVYVIAGAMTLVALFTCWCYTPLIWDGAYQLVYSLHTQEAYSYLTRFHSWVVWQPVIWASAVTEDRTVLTMLYGLPFILAPVVGVLGSWWFVRREAPHLMLWALFGICIAPLPGQIFIINDSIFQQHLFWPVFLGAFVRLRPAQWALWWLLAAFQFSHPIGMPMLGGTAAACALLAWRADDPETSRRHGRRALLLGALALLAAAKIFLPRYLWPAYHDTYAEAEFSLVNVLDRWRKGVAGLAFYGLVLFWAAGIFLFLASRARREDEKAAGQLHALAMACAVVGGGLWVYWASQERLWWGALDYRRWLVPLTLPYFALTFLEMWIEASRARGFAVATGSDPAPAAEGDGAESKPGADRVRVAYVLGLVFLLVLGLQSIVWARIWRKFEAIVRDNPDALIDPKLFAWTTGTPAEHWGLNAQLIFIQGKRVEKMALEDRDLDLMRKYPGHAPLCFFTAITATPGPRGWIDTRPILEAVERKGLLGPGSNPGPATRPANTTAPATAPAR